MPETILIVDDEKEIADLVELYLKNENYPIRKAYDAQTALGIIETESISLALLDIMLPDMDGGRIHALSENSRKAPVSYYYAYGKICGYG